MSINVTQAKHSVETTYQQEQTSTQEQRVYGAKGQTQNNRMKMAGQRAIKRTRYHRPK